MYIIDFFKKIFEKKHGIILAYIALNILVGGLLLAVLSYVFVTGMFLGELNSSFNFLKVFGVTTIISLVIYAISMLVILSPLGEAINRKKYKCKKIERAEHLTMIETLYREVLTRVQEHDSTLSDDIEVFMIESPETTVFALGRRTLAFTSGILEYPAEKTKALLAREFGHISQKDTDSLLLVTSGNFTVNMCIWALRITMYIAVVPILAIGGATWIFAKIFAFMASMDSSAGLRAIGKILEMICKPIPLLAKKILELIGWIGKQLKKLWDKVGVAMVLNTRKEYEYIADEFAFNCGYGETLYGIIANDNLADEGEGIFKEIIMAYPSADSRIAKLQELGIEC